MKPIRILYFCSADRKLQTEITRQLSTLYQIEVVHPPSPIFDILRTHSYDLILIEKNVESLSSGIEVIPQLRFEFPNLAIIVLTEDTEFNDIGRAFSLGASDYLIYSKLIVSDLQLRIPEAVRRFRKDRLLESLSRQFLRKSYILVGQSNHSYEIRKFIEESQNSSAHMLITGPLESGRSSIANEIFKLEADSLRPFVHLDLSLIAPNHLETVLFGDFSPTRSQTKGTLLLADKGDLILDGLDLISDTVQLRLIEFLKNQFFEPNGSKIRIPVKVRVIGITTSPIPDTISPTAKLFYSLLSERKFDLLPLHRRKEDLGLIASEILQRYRATPYRLTKSAIQLIETYPWPGELTQLIYIMESTMRLVDQKSKTEIDALDIIKANRNDLLPDAKFTRTLRIQPPRFPEEISEKNFSDYLIEVEKLYLESVLEVYDQDTKAAALKLNLSRSTLYRRMETLGIITSQESKKLNLKTNLGRRLRARENASKK